MTKPSPATRMATADLAALMRRAENGHACQGDSYLLAQAGADSMAMLTAVNDALGMASVYEAGPAALAAPGMTDLAVRVAVGSAGGNGWVAVAKAAKLAALLSLPYSLTNPGDAWHYSKARAALAKATGKPLNY